MRVGIAFFAIDVQPSAGFAFELVLVDTAARDRPYSFEVIPGDRAGHGLAGVILLPGNRLDLAGTGSVLARTLVRSRTAAGIDHALAYPADLRFDKVVCSRNAAGGARFGNCLFLHASCQAFGQSR